MNDYTPATLTIKEDNVNNVIFTLKGALSFDTIPTLWSDCLNAWMRLNPQTLTIDVEDVTYCDSAGIALLAELKKRQEDAKNTCHILHLKSDFESMLNAISQEAKKNAVTFSKEKQKGHIAITIGKLTVDTMAQIKQNIAFIGEVLSDICVLIRNPKTLRIKDFWKVIEEVGPNALTLIALIGFLMGLILAFQSAITLEKFSAQIYIADLVGISLVRELGPLMTAVILASRTASSFAAEIGTMKINQEIDALSTMGLKPVRFLAVPRIIAASLMTPLLNIFLIFFALVGCGFVMRSIGFGLDVYIQELEKAIKVTGFLGGFFKAIIFGIVISSIGCLQGLKTQLSASGVGKATTQSVVSGIIMIIVIDGMFAYLYYILGI